MPRCKVCGNTRSFGSSKVDPTAPSANGPISGITAEFDAGSNVQYLQSLGADKATVGKAARSPQEYFDVCLQCGSRDIDWNNNTD